MKYFRFVVLLLAAQLAIPYQVVWSQSVSTPVHQVHAVATGAAGAIGRWSGHSGVTAWTAQPASAPNSSHAGNINLNLTSVTASLRAPVYMPTPVNVNIAGVLTAIAPRQAVTPAEMVALHQVLRTGTQTLSLNAQGQAQSGTLTIGGRLNHILSSLTIPQGVTVFDNVGKSGVLNLTGDLFNSGSLIEFTTNSSLSVASINAQNIFNGQGALISSLNGLSLNLNAVNSIVNAGTISGANNLTMHAGNSITNSGLMSAIRGNINVLAAPNVNLTFNNSNGILQALNGSINFRDPSYAGTADTSITGGNYLSQELNLYGGNGNVDLNVDTVTGVVNTWANCAHLLANSPLLQLGVLNASNDPYVTVTGDLDLSSTSFSPYLVAIAGQNIFTSQNNTALVSGGGNIVLIAGATPASTGGSCSSCVTVSRSGLGGDIYLTAGGTFSSLNSQDITAFDTSSNSGNGGNITLVAFASSATSQTNGGHVFLPTNLQVNTNGGGTGSNGNLTVVAEAASGTSNAISIGNVNSVSNSFGSGTGGMVDLSVATPNSGSNGPAIDTTTGNITGSFDTGLVGNLQNGAVNAGNIVTGGAGSDISHALGSVTVSTAGSVTLGQLNTSGINGVAGAAGLAVFDFGCVCYPATNGGPGSDGGNGGNVSIQAGGTITTSNILSFGGGGGGGGGPDLILVTFIGGNGGNGGEGGSGGNISLATTSTAAGAISVVGDLNSSGGGGGGGGSAATVPQLRAPQIVTTPGTGGPGGQSGTVTISLPSTFSVAGNIYAAGGGNGGNGGPGTSFAGGGVGGASFGGGGGGGGGAATVAPVFGVPGGAGGGGYYSGLVGSSGTNSSSRNGAPGGNGGSYANGTGSPSPGTGFNAGSAATGGSISISSSAISGAVTGVINATNGTVTIVSNPGGENIYVEGSALVPGAFNIDQSVLSQITAGSFVINAGSNSGNIYLENSFSASGSVTLETGSSGTITQAAGTLSANAVVLVAGAGIFGSSANVPINTNVLNLSANSSNGSVNISNIGDVTITAPSSAGAGQTFTLSTTGNIFLGTGVTGVQAPNIVLTAGSAIGSSLAPFLIASGPAAGVVNLSAQAGGVVFLSDTLAGDAVDVMAINSGSTISLAVNGSISIVSSVNGGSGISSNNNNITLTASNIVAANTINAGTATVTLIPISNEPIIVNGTGTPQVGTFYLSGSGSSSVLDQIVASTIVVGASTQTGSTSLANPLNVSGSGTYNFNIQFLNGGNFNANGNTISIGNNTLTINSAGSVSLGTFTVTGGSLSIAAGSALPFVIGSNTANGIGALTVLSGPGLANLSITNGGSISLLQQVKGDSVSLTTSNSQGSGAITDPGNGSGSTASIVANTITLQALGTGVADNSIGVTTTANGAAAVSLTALSTNGHVVITNIGNVAITGASGAGNGGFFHLSTSSGSEGSIDVQANVTVAGTGGLVTLIADDAGNIVSSTGTGILAANSVNLVSTSGTIGSINVPLGISTSNISFSTSASVINLQNTGSITLPVISLSATQSFLFSTVSDSNGDGSITVAANGTNPTISAGTIQLATNGPGTGSITQQAAATIASLSGINITLSANGNNNGIIVITTTNNFNNSGVALSVYGVNNPVTVTNVGNVILTGIGTSGAPLSIITIPDAHGNANISVTPGLTISVPNSLLSLVTTGATSTISTGDIFVPNPLSGAGVVLTSLGGGITTGNIFTNNSDTFGRGNPGGSVTITTGSATVNGGNISVGNIDADSYTFPSTNNSSRTSNGMGGAVTLITKGSTASGTIRTGTIDTEGDNGGGKVIISSQFSSVSTQSITSATGITYSLFAASPSGGNVTISAGTFISVSGTIDADGDSSYLLGGAAGTGAAGGAVQLTAGGSTATSGAITVTGDILTFGDAGGGVVTATSTGGNIQTGNILAINLDVISGIYPLSTSSVTLSTGTSSVHGGSISVGRIDTDAQGAYTTSGTGGAVTLNTNGAGAVSGAITIAGDIFTSGTPAGGPVNIASNGGNIVQSAGTITAPSVTLTSTSGNIGSDPNTGGRAVTTNVSSLQTSTSGNAYVNQIGDVTVERSVIGNSTVFSLTSSGNIFLDGAIGKSDMTVGSSGQSITLNAGGSIVNTVANSGNLTLAASSVALNAPSGTVGNGSNPLLVNSPNVSVSATTPNFITSAQPPAIASAISTKTINTETTTASSTESETSSSSAGNAGVTETIDTESAANVNVNTAATNTTSEQQIASNHEMNNAINTDNALGTSGALHNSTEANSSSMHDDQALGQSVAFCSSGNFGSGAASEMASHGANIGPGSTSNFCVLNQGNFLFQPPANITVHVQEGEVHIPAGGSALVMEDGHDVAILDIHDGPHGAVRVKVGDKMITLAPGKQVVLTRQLAADFDKVNPAKLIAYRNTKSEMVASDIRAYQADFSMPSVMMNVAPLRRMLASDSPADRRLAHRMLKQSVVLAAMTPQASPYKTSGSPP